MDSTNIRPPRNSAAGMDRREQIKKCAMEVFGRKGFVQSSLQDIADELGITREAIYYYFGNKKEILLSMILGPSKMMLIKAQEVLASDVSAPVKLQMALRNHLEHFTPSYLEVSITLREKNLFRDEEFAELRSQWKQYEQVWRSIIEEGRAAGNFRQNINPKVMAYAILGMCNWLSRWYRPDGEVGLEELMENFHGLCTDGLLATHEPEQVQ